MPEPKDKCVLWGEDGGLLWTHKYPELFPQIFSGIDPFQIREIFDGGCGFGSSTLCLADFFPQSRIWAVSLGERPKEGVMNKLGRRLVYRTQKIIDSLAENRRQFDLVFLGNVVYPFLEDTNNLEGNGYPDLSRSVRAGGYVLEVEQLSLRENQMKRTGFIIIGKQEEFNGKDYRYRLWCKK